MYERELLIMIGAGFVGAGTYWLIDRLAEEVVEWIYYRLSVREWEREQRGQIEGAFQEGSGE